MKIKLLTVCLLILLSTFQIVLAIPEHLKSLRELQENVLPEDNSYRHRPSVVAWKGYEGAKRYISHTDCSGLVNALMHHSYGMSKHSLRMWLSRARPKAKNYYNAIVERKRFEHILRMEDVLPGDIIAIKFFPWSADLAGDSGHMMVVDDLPVRGGLREVDGKNYQEWKVRIIDSSHGHGKGDSRYRNGKYWPGVGRGTVAIFSEDDGAIVGYSWSTSEKSVFKDRQDRPLVIGRLRKVS